MTVGRYIIVSLAGGILFGILDGLINANPLAQKLFSYLKPIAKPKINAIAGIIIDILYGFIMAAVFLLIHDSLPGESSIIGGLTYGVLIWFFRVFMRAASDWMTMQIPIKTLIYQLLTGAVEMSVIGLLYGLVLK